jgi:MFS family permease
VNEASGLTVAGLRPNPTVAVEALTRQRGALVPAALAGTTIAGLGFVNGGYFPETWGWAGLAFLLAIGVALVAGRTVTLARLDRALLVALSGLLSLTLASALWSESPWRSPMEAQRCC